MSRPEHLGPPELHYDETEASKYAQSSRMQEIQTKLTERALELLGLPEDEECFILDIGCGSGLSGDCLTEWGHQWIGMDISIPMLNIAREREVEGGLVRADMGQGLPFRSGMFDGAISISALQWLCNSDSRDQDPRKRLHTFFTDLYRVLARGSKAVLQWYPENPAQIDLVTAQAMRCGFTGGLLVDYPHSTKARKYFLVLFAGFVGAMPKALGQEGGEEDESVEYGNERNRKRRATDASHRDWVLHKKARQRRQGKEVRPDSKYTGRKRKTKF